MVRVDYQHRMLSLRMFSSRPLLIETFQISLAYIVLTTILFLFPPSLPATGSSMSKLAFSYLVSSDKR